MTKGRFHDEKSYLYEPNEENFDIDETKEEELDLDEALDNFS